MKQETFCKRIEKAGLMTEDKYVMSKYCNTLYNIIKHSGSMKIYDNMFLNKNNLICINPESLQVILQALGMNFIRSSDTIDGVEEYYTYVPANEIRKIKGLTFKSEARMLSQEAFKKHIERQRIIDTHLAEYENAKDYIYYGYGYKFWRESCKNLTDEEAKFIWERAFIRMANC